jgi:hypothetical protein
MNRIADKSMIRSGESVCEPAGKHRTTPPDPMGRPALAIAKGQR